MHPVTGLHPLGLQTPGIHVDGLHDACACALFSVIVVRIAGATYAAALRKWRRARSSSFVSPPSFIAARYSNSNSQATRLQLLAPEFRGARDRFALPGPSAKCLQSLDFSGWSVRFRDHVRPQMVLDATRGSGVSSRGSWRPDIVRISSTIPFTSAIRRRAARSTKTRARRAA